MGINRLYKLLSGQFIFVLPVALDIVTTDKVYSDDVFLTVASSIVTTES